MVKNDKTKFFGILNITPDSFSDGGKFYDVKSALNHLEQLISEGADIIDIGAESTRPNAIAITAENEWSRLQEILPAIIKKIKNNYPQIEISLDSRHHQTISKALDLGIDIINDVTGFDDENMVKLAAKSGKKIVVMHNLGVPADKNKIIPEHLDVTEILTDFIKTKLEQLQNAGIKKENIIFDPGIGFGKNAKQSIYILNNIEKLQNLGIPLLIGHSKKSFLDEMDFGEVNSREEKTALVSAELIKKDVEFLRVHDVRKNKVRI